jgi:type I restriction enzyme S subunit
MNGTQKVVLISEAELGSLFSTGFCFLEPNDALDSKYLFYFLTSEGFQSEKNALAGEGIMGGIKNSDVANMQIPLPPLPEQQRIVRLLDEAFEGIATAKANAEKSLQNAYKLLNVYLASVFTNTKGDWDQKNLGDVCTFENGDRGENYPSASVRTPTGVPFINAGHLTEGKVDFRSMDYIPKSRFDLLSNGKIRPGDILFCLRGSLGKFATVGDLSEGAIASSLVIIRTEKMLLPEFLLGYLKSPLCAAMIQKHKGGTAQPNLSAASLRSFVMPLPRVSDQQRIVDGVNSFSDAIDRLSEIYKTKAYALSALENSILNRSFVSDATGA